MEIFIREHNYTKKFYKMDGRKFLLLYPKNRMKQNAQIIDQYIAHGIAIEGKFQRSECYYIAYGTYKSGVADGCIS